MTEEFVYVRKVEIFPHENADSLEVAKIGGYTSIVRKDSFKAGDLVAYIPEAAIVPDDLLEEMGLLGMLSGSKKNRVKAIRLRGVFSQGLCYPAKPGWVDGQDVGDELGIDKYEVEIPLHMGGQMERGPFAFKYDIKNFKDASAPKFEVGEDVCITEKIHGTLTAVIVDVNNRVGTVSSKGLLAQGISLVESESNLYWSIEKEHGIIGGVLNLADQHQHFDHDNIIIFGETFGNGVQDLGYGVVGKKEFRAFDVAVKNGNAEWRFFGELEFTDYCELLNIKPVPRLYVGPYTPEVLTELTDGKETVSGKSAHTREGVVIKSVRSEPRKVAKSVSEKYLLRKNGTEYN